MGIGRVLTDEETKETDPSRRALHPGPIEDVPKLAHLGPEGRHGEEDEEYYGERERDSDERRRRRGGSGKEVRRITWEHSEVWDTVSDGPRG